MQVKHFEWSHDDYGRGRVAIAIDEATMTVELAQIAGNAPPAALAAWGNLINEFEIGGKPALVAAEKLHASRVNRFAVLHRVGMSGSQDYRLVIEKDARLRDFPTAARLHISMNGKLNEGLKMWLGDFEPIYTQWCADNSAGEGLGGYTAEPGEALVIREVPTRGDDIEWRDAAAEMAEFVAANRYVDALLERIADD